MDPLPTIQPDFAASCELDADGLRAQAERYRRAGEGAELLERSPRRLAVRLRDGVDVSDVTEAVAIERDCCPFYEIDWDPDPRELSFAVTRAEHEPALGAIADALGLS
ncbi:MAG: hypothetical protein ACRDKH_05065 [Solirubrobacterales bacterium]